MNNKQTIHSTTTNNPICNARDPVPLSCWRKVPVVSWVRAGEAVGYQDLCAQIEEWIEADTKDANAFSLILEGDSMEPDFRAGDRVLCSPNAVARNGCFVAARLRDGGLTFKKFFRTGPAGRRVRLEPLNPNYPTREYDESEFIWLYPVTGSMRKLWV